MQARHRRIRAALFACVVLAALVAPPERARAVDPNPAVFDLGRMSLGFFSGAGFGFARPGYAGGETDEVLLVPFYPQLGIGISGPLGGEAWYAGAFEMMLEGTFLVNTSPRSGFAGGGGVLFRYDFLSVPHVVPYAELGGGMLDLEFDLNDQRDGFNFSLDGGLGIRWFIDANTVLSLAYRWQHLSNAGTALPNDGIDTHQPLLGISYYFDS
ncbi:MAG: acyloxyacyl hydrolase [Deltaproteobacteria bacterium]|nr:acyloxyacyl hydrolase [Deltaproteobacteria bacterium]